MQQGQLNNTQHVTSYESVKFNVLKICSTNGFLTKLTFFKQHLHQGGKSVLGRYGLLNLHIYQDNVLTEVEQSFFYFKKLQKFIQDILI